MYFAPAIFNNINNPQNGEALIYDSAQGLWVNGEAGSGNVLGALGIPATAAEVFPRGFIGGASAAASGEVHLSFFEVAEDITVSNITMAGSNTIASGITLIRMGLYEADVNDSVTLVARAAVDNTLFTSSQVVYTRAFDTTGGYPASYNLVAGTRYALGHIIVATTRPTIIHNFLTNTNLTAIAPRISGSRTGQTDLPTTLNAPGVGGTEYVNSNRAYYGRFS